MDKTSGSSVIFNQLFCVADITSVSIPVEEFEAPSLQQIKQFVSVVDSARKVNQVH